MQSLPCSSSCWSYSGGFAIVLVNDHSLHVEGSDNIVITIFLVVSNFREGTLRCYVKMMHTLRCTWKRNVNWKRK